ncbi:MAG TPA: hypothetical protein V6D17_21305 [Candidatus Obscuribacterales bacterium]
MKVLERNFENKIDVAAGVVMWNHWDHEHLTVVHKNYTDCKLLHETDDTIVQLVSYRVPIFSFLISHSMGTVVLTKREGNGGTMQQFNLGFLGIPSITTIDIIDDGVDHCTVRTNYKFLLHGWKVLLAPLLYKMMEKWNRQVWLEDLPLKLRRHKVLRAGFQDFIGMPEKVADRHDDRAIECRIPLPRPADSPVNSYFNTLLKKKPGREPAS